METLPERPKAAKGKQPAKRKDRQSTTVETERPKPKRPRGGASRSRSAKRGLEDDDHGITDSSSDEDPARVRATLYDAVAGRVGYEGFLLDKPGRPLPPDQVLFGRADAPIRYQEDDKYFAHRNLPATQRLPDSDLLKAIHAYASDFYGSGKLGSCRDDFCSLDETALLALGILLEETAAESLGSTGDLAFVEGPQTEGMP